MAKMTRIQMDVLINNLVEANDAYVFEPDEDNIINIILNNGFYFANDDETDTITKRAYALPALANRVYRYFKTHTTAISNIYFFITLDGQEYCLCRRTDECEEDWKYGGFTF